MYQLLNYQKMAKLGKIAAYYIDTARIISPKQNEKYNHYEKLFSQIQGNIQNQKKKNSFSIKCNDKNCSAIIAGLSSILEESGFVISPNNSIYKILVDIHFIEEEYEAGNFVRPDILITILNGNGSVIDSYSKAYPRYSHQNMKNAYSLAFVRIEQDLEENFLVDYRGE